MENIAETERRLVERIRRDGLLLFTDPRLPSAVSVITGAPPVGSWFGHPASGLIYVVGQRIEDSPEILDVPLLRGKVTLVHRRLWPELFGVATSGEEWQTRGLSKAQSTLLRLVVRKGRVNVQTEVADIPLARERTLGDLARSLQQRLLVYGSSVHSPSGRHEKRLQTWAKLKVERRIAIRRVSPRTARSSLEAAAAASLGPARPPRLFPWERRDGR